ncbi:MAG: hypothetical protein E7012_01520 [Alphaproteobacteria bacterium]|nr:hypothetical protein [Alphaproteobacteria bacterium]
MKQLLFIMFLLTGCVGIDIPDSFEYKIIKTDNFKIASWQKITNPKSKYKVYIEGDGHAFNARGKATGNPTPKGKLVRELAFGDENDNVIYLARPCQYIKGGICSQRHWTTARFAPEIIKAEEAAIKQIVGKNDVVLVGFSGGAQVAGLVATLNPDLKVKKIITIAGNLNHREWTNYHILEPLSESMSLENYRKNFLKIPQVHYVGECDEVIPPFLVKEFVWNNGKIVEVKGATHNFGWEKVFSEIRKE